MKLFDKPLELIILDVDGVLLDLVACFQQNLEAAATQLGLPIGPLRRYITAVRAGEKRGKASLTEGIREFYPLLDTEKVREFARCFRDTEKQNPYPPYPGSIKTVLWFQEHNIPVALCTTNEKVTLEHRLHAAGMNLEWFSAVSTWEDGFPKPDPRALDPIFQTTQVPREHAVYIGDWYPDLEAARGARVRFIAVLSGGIPRHAFRREGVREDHILEKLADIRKLIQTSHR